MAREECIILSTSYRVSHRDEYESWSILFMNEMKEG